MEARFLVWWQKAKNPLEVFCVIVVSILAIALVVVIALAYIFNVNVPGLRGKTIWDWLQLLIIPLALAIIAFLFNRAERKNEQTIASDNQQEASLQGYLNKMFELLLHEKIREPTFKDASPFEAQNEAQHAARASTLTVLPKLDAGRKKSVIQFLHEANLISKNERIVHLNDADLSGADLSGASLFYSDLHKVNLSKANLSKANLCESDLSEANLSEANLREARLSWGKLVIHPTGANLSGADLGRADLSRAIMNDVILINADLSRANLSDADLSGANLTNAKVTNEQLDQAKSLKGATLRDGSTRP